MTKTTQRDKLVWRSGDVVVIAPKNKGATAWSGREHYDPTQPREPAGGPEGGRWASGGVPSAPAAERVPGVRVAPFDEFPDLDNGDLVVVERLRAAGVSAEPSNLALLHPYYRRVVLEEAEEFTRDYPGALKELTVYDPELGLPGRGDLKGDSCFARGGGGVIWLNRAWFRDPAKMQDALGWGTTKGNRALAFHDEMKDVRSVIRHEAGHVLHDYLRSQPGETSFTGYLRASGWGSVKDVTYAFQRAHHGSWSELNRLPVSDYAKTNENEWFAETYAALKWGGQATKAHPQAGYMSDFLATVANPKKWTANASFLDESKIGKTSEQLDAMYREAATTAYRLGLADPDTMHVFK